MTHRAVLLRAALAFLCLHQTSPAQAPHQPHLHPVIYRSSFQPNPGATPDSGSRDGWESYPISQETGYDPTINPETLLGQSALVRENAPNQDGPFRLGFIRRLHMVSGSAASLTARIRVPSAANLTKIDISIFRGEKEERHTAIITGSAWQQVKLPIDPNPAWMTAVTISAEFPQAVHGRMERVIIADVRIHALGIQPLKITAPATLSDPSRKLSYFRKAIYLGDDFAAAAAAAGHKDIAWRLTAPAGNQIAQGQGSHVMYRFRPTDPAGVWTLTISNADASTTALILVKPRKPQGLLFEDPPAIAKDLLTTIELRRAVLEKIAHPETGLNIPAMDSHWLLAGLPSYFNILLQSPELAMLNAMECRATASAAPCDRARALLRSIATWPMWVHPWFPAHGYHSYYPVGIMTKYVVLAEQFLGNALPLEDKHALDRSLMDLSVKPIYTEYVQEDRLQFNTSNWIGNTVGGALLAALQSNEEDAAGYALGLYVKERDHVQAAYTPDGSYGEGVTYQRFDLEMTTLVAEASKRLLGTSLDDYLLSPERYLTCATYGADGLMDFGDSHVDLTPSNVFAYQAALNNSPATNDFYFRYRDQGPAQIISRVLWEPSIKHLPIPPPPQNPSAIFAQRGIAVLRDSFDPLATVIAMRAGKNFNHNHADQGSLFFAHNGKLWFGEAGYADYYKDPSYPTYNIQAIGHNTLLVDGNPESQALPGNAVFGTSPSIPHSILAPQASLIQADLTSAYAGKLTTYTRTLFFLHGGPLIVIDDITSAHPHRYTQLWHPTQPITASSPAQNLTLLHSAPDTLQLTSFATGKLTTTQHPAPLPLTSYEQSEHTLITRPIYLSVSTTTPQQSETIVSTIQSTPSPTPHWTTTHTSSTLQSADTGIRISHLPTHTIEAWWPNGAALIHATHYVDPTTGATITATVPIDIQLDLPPTGPITLTITSTQKGSLTFTKWTPSPLPGASIPFLPGRTSFSLQRK